MVASRLIFAAHLFHTNMHLSEQHSVTGTCAFLLTPWNTNELSASEGTTAEKHFVLDVIPGFFCAPVMTSLISKLLL
jgi:hypothetical protein